MAINSYVARGAVVGALGGLLFGFDTAVIAGTTDLVSAQFGLTAWQQAAFVSSALWGTVLGALGAGVPGERMGGRNALRVMAVLYLVSAVGCAFAPNLAALIVFRFLGGIGIGGSSVLAPVYIAELAPAKLRGRLVGMFQINVVGGILVAYLSNSIIAMHTSGAANWRWDFGVAAFPAVLFLVMLFAIPQSARWLVTQGRTGDAMGVLQMLGAADAEAELGEIVASVRSEGSAAHEAVFQRKYWKPIYLAIAIGAFNQLSGINAILYYLNHIFEAAGYTRMSGNVQAVVVGATNFVATLVAMTIIDNVGRKRLLLWGSVVCSFCLACVGAIFAKHSHQQYLVYFLVADICAFAMSQGAVIWVYISEVFPNRVRAKGQSIGCSAHWIMNAMVSFAFPVVAKTTSSALPFFFFAVMMAAQFFVVWFTFPETKGASLEQLQARLVES
jgi:sugar porter (SP) family MFS transporter